ncbi:MAG TPA: hypothetical protein VKB80_23110 [Kofleriaceae bacterium]|nr:hypothetical protein [Kofleriaceae bacterium]
MTYARCALLVLVAATACSRDRTGDAAGQGARDGEREAATPVAAEKAVAGEGARAQAGAFEDETRSPQARDHFRRGMRALHAFWYEEATRQFEAAIAADGGFVMARWGLVMSKSKILWGDDDLTGGRGALAQLPPSSSLSPRDRAWVEAARALFGEGNVRTSRKAFADAMEQVHARFPDDESATFLALALLATTRPEDPKGDAVRRRAADLAMEVYRRNPDHPGAAHYAIHALDTPELAHLALPMAVRYAAIAPEAYHARHMPAHIFARLGMWKEAMASCRSAWDASVAWAAREKLPADHHDYHSLSWIIEMSFERGRRADADAAMKLFSGAVKAGLNHQNRTAYAGQVASYLARTGEWKRADELLAPLDAPATDDPPGGGKSGAGATACAQHAPQASGLPLGLIERRAALGARTRAASGRRDLAATRRLIADRAALDKELQPFLAATQPPDALAKLERNRAQADAAMIARARGDDRGLLAPLEALVQSSQAEYAAEGTAGGSLAGEELADALLRLGRAKEALAAYQVVLSAHAGRARSLLGAARAARRAGDAAAARTSYEKLLAVWSEADEGTDGLAEARRAVAAAR